jgi:glutamyl-tRNA synthetase
MQWRGADLGGDMVIARRASASSIGDPLYNLVVVVDDAAMAITHVIRGEDHIANTAKQLLLYQALELSSPTFAHTPLILNPEGRKLSKRDGVTSISDFQAMGYTSEALANYMTLLGWSVPEGMDEQFTLLEAAQCFSFDRVNKAGAKFDWDKLNWLNAQLLHGWPSLKLLEALEPRWQREGWIAKDRLWANDLAILLGPSLTLLEDGVNQARPFFEEPALEDDALNQLEQDGARPALQALLCSLELNAWDGVDVELAQTLLKEASASADVKKGILMKSLRAALLGRLQGPDLITTWGLLARLGDDRKRLRRCL